MPWVTLDDHFTDHPKVAMVGGDAAWLFVAGLCYAQRHLTDGKIPKAVIGQLTDRKTPSKLAKRLVDVRLWEEEGDHYVVHDWPDYNEPSEEVRRRRGDKAKDRSEHARKAAQHRWGNARGDAQPMPDHPPDDAQHGARAVPGAMPPDATPSLTPSLEITPPPTPSPVPNGLPMVGERLDDESVTGGVGYRQGSKNNRSDLVKRLVSVCTAENRRLVEAEAAQVIAHVTAHVDFRVVDEAIGAYAASDKRPTLPRALVPAVQKRASSAGITLPSFTPKKVRA